MKIDFRLSLDDLTSNELAFLSTQVRFATRFHDAPLEGVRVEQVPEPRGHRARVTAIEQGGATVVTERDAATPFEAICEAIWVLDRALHALSMERTAYEPPERPDDQPPVRLARPRREGADRTLPDRANLAQQDWAA